MAFDCWLIDPVSAHSSGNDTQDTLLSLIEKNPGIRYRELLRMARLVNGVLTYHLTALEKSHKINVERQSRITRYYPLDISVKDSVILKHIRQNTIRQMVMFILEHDLCTFNEIVDHTKKSASTVSHYLTRLKDAEIISVRYGGEYHLYRIADKESVTMILSRYRESFVDKVVDNYIEMVEDL